MSPLASFARRRSTARADARAPLGPASRRDAEPAGRGRRRQSVARGCGVVATVVAACAGRGASPLAAQSADDSATVSVAGHGPVTYVLLSGMVGGIAGFRRLEARLLEHGHRVVIIDPYRLSLDSPQVSFAALAARVDAVLIRRGVDSARVVAHAHGAGVALRLAASAPGRVSALYFLDVGALAGQRSRLFSASLRLAPLIARVPGGRGLVRDRFLRGLRQNAGRREWLDRATQRAYAEPMLDALPRVVAMATRLARAAEPEPVAAVVARVRVPLVVLAGAAPHPAGPGAAELAALVPLGARLRVERMPGVGHFPHEESPAEVARLITARAPPGYAARRRPGSA